MAATWEEIRQLQADFKQVQRTKLSQKLSERNCIELVLRLIDLKLIDVVHTTDGREYVTNGQVKREIQDELLVHAGRLQLADLSASLNLDFSIVEAGVKDLVREKSKSLHLISGQLISREYLDRISEEVDDVLQTQGSVNLAHLTTVYDLPLEFLHESFLRRLGSIIRGRIDAFDKNVFYTDAFLSRHRARITGAMRGITRPTSVASLLESLNCQSRLFFSTLDVLIAEKKVLGSLIGGHQDSATFVPDVYSRSQDEWIDAFYQQNGYFDYSSMNRLGIADAKNYIKKKYPEETRQNTLLNLSSVCVGRGFLTTYEGLVEDALAEESWFDVATQDVTTVSLTDNDFNKLLIFILKRLNIGDDRVKIYDSTILFCEAFRHKFMDVFEPVIQKSVNDNSKENAVILKKAAVMCQTSGGGGGGGTEKADDESGGNKDDRRKRAAGGKGSNKSGGGTAREIKTKSTKKKGNKRDVEEEDPEALSRGGRNREVVLELMTKEAMAEFLESKFEEIPSALTSELVEEMQGQLNKKYTDSAKALFNAASGSVADKRKMHQDIGDKVNSLVTEIRMYEKGISAVGSYKEDDLKASKEKDNSLNAQLTRYLLKTLGTEICNALFNLTAADVLMKIEDDSAITPEIRVKILANINTEPLKTHLVKLNVSLNDNSLFEFLTQLENVSSELQILVKRADKKKDKQLLQSHRAALLEKMQQEVDPALLLHLAISLVFQNVHQAMLHCSGKMIPQIINYLRPKLDEDLGNRLIQFQELVITQLTAKAEDFEANDVSTQLVELAPSLKEAIIIMRKGSVAE